MKENKTAVGQCEVCGKLVDNYNKRSCVCGGKIEIMGFSCNICGELFHYSEGECPECHFWDLQKKLQDEWRIIFLLSFIIKFSIRMESFSSEDMSPLLLFDKVDKTERKAKLSS